MSTPEKVKKLLAVSLSTLAGLGLTACGIQAKYNDSKPIRASWLPINTPATIKNMVRDIEDSHVQSSLSEKDSNSPARYDEIISGPRESYVAIYSENGDSAKPDTDTTYSFEIDTTRLFSPKIENITKVPEIEGFRFEELANGNWLGFKSVSYDNGKKLRFEEVISNTVIYSNGINLGYDSAPGNITETTYGQHNSKSAFFSLESQSEKLVENVVRGYEIN